MHRMYQKKGHCTHTNRTFSFKEEGGRKKGIIKSRMTFFAVHPVRACLTRYGLTTSYAPDRKMLSGACLSIRCIK